MCMSFTEGVILSVAKNPSTAQIFGDVPEALPPLHRFESWFVMSTGTSATQSLLRIACDE